MRRMEIGGIDKEMMIMRGMIVRRMRMRGRREDREDEGKRYKNEIIDDT